MIGATLNTDTMLQHLAAIGPRADAALRDSSADLVDRLRNAVDRNLSGGVLKTRSGALRVSLAGTLTEGTGLTGTVSVGTPYAAFQEYGFSGTEGVRAYLRQRRGPGRRGKSGPILVRAHDRRVDYPAHSFLRSALAEMAPDIRRAIAAAVAGAIAS